MTKKMTVFIHTNPQQMVGAKVGEYSLRKNSKNNDKFDVQILNLWDFPNLTSREGTTYLRKGKQVTWRNQDLQSFSPLRFLPPQLMGYEGRAVLIDPDIFALTDIYELLNRDMEGKALWCRKGYPEKPQDPNHNTSVMVMDCAKLRHWNWEKNLDDMFADRLDYGDWIFLRKEDPATIGDLEEEWNHWDTLNDKTKLLHNTERSTQPWKTGLPVDYNLNYKPATPIKQPEKQSNSLLSIAKRMLSPKPRIAQPADAAPQETYRKHPDEKQERFFFKLLKECLDKGVITEAYLKQEIQDQHVRPDAIQYLKSVA